ncbi:MAG: PilC/PilY family type IV pilus protein [Nitrospira sp.]|nr:PilC/PilY family type IV pilus protein [Nitrospira sp.]
MKSRNIATCGAVMLAVLVCLWGARAAQAQTMDQYYAVPPFVSDQVAPNILILMDNSGSMTNRACESANCGTLPPPGGGVSTVTVFTNSTRYSGFFDPLSCYTYNGAYTVTGQPNGRFELAGPKAPAAVATACSSTQWDGNFLNWAVFRRFDAVKVAMIGGDCAVGRAADGTCPATGAPSMKTIASQRRYAGTGNGHETAAIVSGGGINGYGGRIPTAATPGTPGTIRVHLRGGTSGMQGTFCIDDDATAPGNTATTCVDADGFAETQYAVRLAVATEPAGVVQQIGPQARFGLAVFNNNFAPSGSTSGQNDGLQVLVGIGSRQSIDFNGTFVETFNTNTAAMVDAVEEAWPSTWTPLAETLYEAARYVAQINSSMYPSAYVYPIGYAPGVALATNGIGSLGTGGGGAGTPEITALTGTEVCPSGYVSGGPTATCAAGRDPYFYGSNHTPAWATTSTQVPCCKTFVLVFTDGEPTQDRNIPGADPVTGVCTSSSTSLCNYAQANAPAYAGTPCTSNRGAPYVNNPGSTCNNDPATPPNILLKQHRTDYDAQGFANGTHFLDDVAYWSHINDLRPCNGTADGTIAALGVSGRCLPGLQNLTVYTFYAFGVITGRELLMHAALLGGFEDTNNNKLPDLQDEWDKVINATGAPGSDGIPDTYFESSNVDDLQDRLMATITAIIRKSASGTSISVLATASTGEGSIYQAYFFTSDVGLGGANVKWTGYTHSLFVDGFGNFREDTVQDGKLVYEQDRIITTRYDNDPSSGTYQKVLVDKFVDLNGDGVADSATPILTSDLKSIVPVWEAGKELAYTTSGARTILTWVDANNNGVVDPAEQIDFNTANCAALKDYLRYPAATACDSGGSATNLINFIRGDEVAGLRTRMLETPVGSRTYKVWKLGDPIHSTPTIVSAPKARYDLAYGDADYNLFYQKYRNRRQVAYVGANDGMLHAFNGGYYHKGDDSTTAGTVEHGWYTKNPTDNSSGPNLGAEMWSFIPQELLPQLQWLARVDYSHVYYVDLKPTITEARVFTPDADHPGGWGTLLIGGFRMGGSCGQCIAGGGAPPMTATIGGTSRTFYSAYFALDVTNPEVSPKLKWVFTDSGLGLTTSYPSVVRMKPDSITPPDTSTSPLNEKWFVIFGSGPNGYQADLPVVPGPTQQGAKLYVVDLKNGPKVAPGGSLTTMPVGTWRSFMGHVVSIDKDLDWRTDVAYSGRTIHDGALPWRGKMYRLTMNCPAAPCTTDTWGIANGANRTPTEVIDTFVDAGTGTTVEVGPTAAAPAVTIDDTNATWVFFGTGRYFGNADKVDEDIQRLYGLKDKVMNGTCVQTTTVSCFSNDLVNVTNAVVCLVCASGTNQVSDPTNPGATSVEGTGANSMMGLVASKDGWRVTLPGPVTISGVSYSAERSVVNPTLIAGVIFLPTFVPTNNFCASDGISYLYVLFYKTGTAPPYPVVGTTPSGANTNINTRVDLGVGLASSGSMHTGQEGAKINFQLSGGNANSPPAGLNGFYSKYVSWVHQRD